MKLDWQHVAILILAAVCLAALWWFAAQTGNAALVAIGIPATGGFITTLGALFKESPSVTQTTGATVTVTEPKAPAP